MIGRRVPDDAPWYTGERQPGDYGLVNGAWWIMDPKGEAGSLLSHEVIEHEDRTITVSPSILSPEPGGWHGYLERGVWREA